MKIERVFLSFVFVVVFCFSSCVFGYSDGAGTFGDPYQIANKADLLELAGTVGDYGKFFVLTADIDLEGEFFDKAVIAADTNNVETGFQGTWFEGAIDGQGFVIRNLTIYGCNSDYVGLIGNLNGSNIGLGLVKNLVLENADVTGKDNVGGLVGLTRNWAVWIENCGVIGVIDGEDNVGGLVGYNSGGNASSAIERCFAEVSVLGDDHVGGLVGCNWEGPIKNSYAIATVDGEWCVGGLTGRNFSGSITNCYAGGEVIGLERVGGLVGENENMIDRAYSTADVNGINWVGGLVGNGNSANVTRSFWDMETSHQVASAGGMGLITVLMKDIDTYLNAEWDFVDEEENGTENIWRMSMGSGYPALWWEPLFNDRMSGAGEIMVGDVISGSSVGAGGDDITLMGYKDWADVWFYFDCNETGKYTVGVEPNGFDSTVAVFDDDEKEIIFNDDFFGGKSVVILKASAGRKYYIRIAGYDGQTGLFNLSLQDGAIQVIQGDLNYDGFVDLVDFAIMAESWLVDK